VGSVWGRARYLRRLIDYGAHSDSMIIFEEHYLNKKCTYTAKYICSWALPLSLYGPPGIDASLSEKEKVCNSSYCVPTSTPIYSYQIVWAEAT
jgi:hypothetical protein